MEMYEPGALEQVREESIRRLDGGGLPVLAERRLAALFGSSAERFITHLSVGEFALTRSTGVRSVSQVMARASTTRSSPWTGLCGRGYTGYGSAVTVYRRPLGVVQTRIPGSGWARCHPWACLVW
jgi:hypothetical protein